MAVLRLQNVTKIFTGDAGEEVTAVQDLSLDVQPGEIMVLVGESGSGKSTTLRLIAGLEELTRGEIFLEEHPMKAVPPARRDIAMVFQQPALYPHMSAGENLGFGLRIRGVSAAEIEGQVRQVSELLGIASLLQRRPGELSGGQQQRVALGRAIIRRPRLFLFDEPLSQLDQKTRLDLRKEILRLHERLGTAMLYVTHDPVEAMTLGHRIAVIQAGRLRQCASPREIYERPADRSVADFLGAPGMNFIHGVVIEAGGRLLFREQTASPGTRPLLEMPIPPDITGSATPLAGQEVVLGVRPEALVLCDDLQSGAVFEGRVVRTQDLGPETHVHIAGTTHTLLARVSPGKSPGPGSVVRVGLDPQRTTLFSARTGVRIG